MSNFTRLPMVIALMAAITAVPPAFAASVDLSSAPLVTGTTKAIAPNIFFVLDDSTSMSFEYVPDSVGEDASSNCFKNPVYNKMYFDPAVTYTPPVKTVNSDGSTTNYANATFTNAQDDGFCTSSCSKTNLNTSFKAYQTYGSNYSAPYIHTNNDDTAQQAYYYKYTTGTAPNSCAANNKYTKVTISSTSPDATNFANWYSFYRTRLLMTKSAAGAAFASIDDKYRVGFTVLSQTGTPSNSSDFLGVSKFNGTQKQKWFADLYASGCPSNTTCSTPTRGALAKAGRYFAGQFVSASTPDPIQYSCQKNFTVLVTDGYWNTGDETSCSSSSKYSACQISSGSVGDQDGSGTAKPYYDGLGVSNSLADIAMYYWKTDLRPTSGVGGLTEEGTNIDVSANNVAPVGADTATWQHMNTFTVGLGVPGVLNYADNYQQGGSSDYNAILQGTKNWPDPQTSSSASSVPARLDDLWHAAVNGRGIYLDAKTPAALTAALGKAISSIGGIAGAGAAAATSNLEPVAGDNFAFVPQYTTTQWIGDLQGRTIDLTTGALSSSPGLWSASTQLQAMVAASGDTRTIYTFSATATNKLKTFVTGNLTTEKAAGYFKSSSTNPNGALTQYAGFNSTQQTAATDDAMIAYLRGQTGNDLTSTNTNQLFRQRVTALGAVAPLGDIVSSKPVYVKSAPFNYSDTGYAAFITTQSTRSGRVYAGANDGMLHAFDATTGNETWAYIPSMLIPQLYKLADSAYAANHQFYADGPIVVGDAASGTTWKTILVGGLGRGGRGYYALDVTDPANPAALWEFGTAQDANIGYSYGNPLITKRASDGKWVVIVSSGYNNASPGDGKARLYVLDAFTGAKLQEIAANTASADPNANGIARVANWVDDGLIDNTTQYVYAGDLSGNVWRFDLSSTSAAQRLGYTSATAGNQPITVRPELAQIKDASGTAYRVVFFGTGRYLGFTDITPTSPSQSVAQAVYAVKDTGADLGLLTAGSAKLVAQTLNTGNTPRTIATPATVNWASNNGWYMSFPVTERVTVDPALQLGTFVVATNIPEANYCFAGGTSWLYTLNYKTGGPVSTAASQGGQQVVGTFIGNALTVGVSLLQLPGGKVIALVSKSDTSVDAKSVPIEPSATVSLRRLGWRELN